jgi:PAS domain S-box-containing protein
MLQLIKNLITNVIRFGSEQSSSHSDKRNIQLSNFLSLVLSVASCLMVLFRLISQHAVEVWFYAPLFSEALLYLALILVTRAGLVTISRMVLCWAPPIFLVINFRILILHVPVPETSHFVGFRIFQIAFSIFPFLMFSVYEKWKFFTALSLPLLMILVYDRILNLFGVGYYQLGLHDTSYLYNNFRTLIGSFIIGSTFMFLKKIVENQELKNESLIAQLGQQNILIQNNSERELKKAAEQHEATLNRITSNVVSFDNDLRYVYINDAALSIHPLGRDGTIGKTVAELYPQVRQNLFYEKLLEARKKMVEVDFETFSPQMNKWFLIKIYPSADGITVFSHDVTNQKASEKKIADSELRLSESQAVAKIGSWETDLSSLKVTWSRETYRIFELDPEKFQPTHTTFLEFVHPDDRQKVDAAFNASLPDGQLNIIEHRIITPSGKVLWTEERWYVSVNSGGAGLRAFGTCQDITDRKNIENQVTETTSEVRKLTAHLENVREEERTRMAREIHDELGQQLTGLKMDAEWVAKKTHSNEVVSHKMSDMIALIDETVGTVRRLVSELRPGVLDDLGLVSALEWQCKEFERRTGIICETHNKCEGFIFGKNISINLFRIYQEALTNITRHAKATKVVTQLEEKDGYVILTIKDNGVGFDKVKKALGNSWGLIGMRERVKLFGGELRIDSQLTMGTVITIKIPIGNCAI